jgi:plastocyanin
MKSSLSLVTVLVVAITASSCAKDEVAPVQNPVAPAPPSIPSGPTAPPSVTISIVGTLGNGSYVPNPVPVQSGEQVIFKNNDAVVHRIVMNDNSADTGNLAPGASSQALGVASGDFHCTIHPSMVGSINGLTAPEPPPGSGDGY